MTAEIPTFLGSSDVCECGGGGRMRRGMCGACYARWLRRQPNSPKDTPTPIQRFWAKVNKTDTCWLWTGTGTQKGYGQFAPHSSRHVLAHRYAYESLVGPIPDGLTIDHLCRVRNCVNPAHMEVVTRGENTRRGQTPTRCDHCQREITPANMRRHVAAQHLASATDPDG